MAHSDLWISTANPVRPSPSEAANLLSDKVVFLYHQALHYPRQPLRLLESILLNQR